MRIPFSLFTFVLFTMLSSPVSDAADKTERKKRPAPINSPTIHEDDSVTFRISAPKAETVQVRGEMLDKALDLEKDDKGLWSGTIPPVEPGIYGYSFVIDGVSVVDPGNQFLKPMRSPKTSILHIPGDNDFDFKDVPHGTVHQHDYFSDPINRFRQLRVYTPPGYETSEARYPVLILQHGHSDKFATWTDYGKAHWILDNLIAEKRAVPMIVVMLDGHPIPESYGDGRSTNNTEELRRDLVEAVLPMIEEKYRTKPGRKNRAIAGLSMGGLHSLTIGFNHLDLFSEIGSFSGAMPDPKAIKPALSNPERTNRLLDLLWIACGKDDFLLDENRELVGMLEEKSIDHEWVLTEGAHAWPVWRGYLADFAPLLFRGEK